jgi:hypothetical protein
VARTSKSPRAVLLAALATAKVALPLYSHRYSPKKFTQHQLFACLVLKSFLKTDYRGLAAHLADCASLLEVLQLDAVPHYTTLQKASCRLLAAAPARRLLDATVREHMGRKRRVRRAAIDSTGLESSAASGYFIRRRERVGMPWKEIVYHHFPKLGVVCDVEAHFILAAREDRGPKPDVADFRPLLAAALMRVGIERVVADAGYDSGANHEELKGEELKGTRLELGLADLRGRPRGWRVDSEPRRLAVACRQSGVPNGLLRRTACRSDSNSASVWGALTYSTQRRGRGSGQRLNIARVSASPEMRRHRLDQRHASACVTSPARSAFRSTYRMTV